MTDTSPRPPSKARPGPDSRDDRLKAALKANMARRKAQARARAAGEADGGDGQGCDSDSDNR